MRATIILKEEEKLLLNKQELKKIQKQVKDAGITVVALSLFISKKGIAKLNVSVAKGKREFDKRNVIKDRESKISLKRIKKILTTNLFFFSIGTNLKLPKVSFFKIINTNSGNFCHNLNFFPIGTTILPPTLSCFSSSSGTFGEPAVIKIPSNGESSINPLYPSPYLNLTGFILSLLNSLVVDLNKL